ncbi:MAG TPA: ABC transporter substrate-binding protein [Blastocatellia bacterium]|nr:ABC transporter substrate-binding protein [Blastocatellia bacterium]
MKFQISNFKFKTTSLLLLILLLLAGASSACKRGGEPGTLVVAIELAPRGFDPRFSSTTAISARIMQLIYDTLLVKNEKFDLVPSLAESFEESEDAKTFTFRLRRDAVFHNGKPLTARDVKFTFASIGSPELRSPLASTVSKIASIETPDEFTVVFRAREPFYNFTANLPAIGIIPDGAGEELLNAPIGSGPYKFVSYSEGDPVKLEANPDYWGGAPLIPRVYVRVVTDNSTRQAELLSGEVDLAYNAQFDPETIRALQNRSGIQVMIGDGTNVGYLGLNLTKASPLSDQKVRQAVAHAIDTDVIIERLLRNQAKRAVAILPTSHWAYDAGVKVYDYNTELAKQLLDEAGRRDPDGDGPQTRFEITMVTSTTQLSRNIAAIMQDQFRRVGIALNLQSFESATLFDRINKLQFDLYYLINIGGNQNTDIFQFVYHGRYQDAEFNDAVAKLRLATDPAAMRPMFEKLAAILARREYCPNPEVERLREQAESLNPVSDAAEKKELYVKIAQLLTDRGGQNRMRYCNPQVDGWIVEAEQAPDRPTKMKLYSQIQRTVAEELPQVYLWYPANVLVARARVGNIEIEPSGSWYFITKLTLE